LPNLMFSFRKLYEICAVLYSSSIAVSYDFITIIVLLMLSVACVAASRIAVKMYAYVKEHKVNPVKNVVGPMSQVDYSFTV